MNKHYRERTVKQVEDKINHIKTKTMIHKLMSQDKTITYLDRLVQRMARRKRIKLPCGDGKKVRRLERKKRRLEQGKWGGKKDV